LRKRARQPTVAATRLAVVPMSRFCGRFLPLVVLLAGFPCRAFAQRTQSFAPTQSSRSSSNIMSAKPATPRASGTAVKTPFSSVSILPNRSTANAKGTNSDGHRFANSADEEQHELIPLQVTNTPFATESRLPIAPLLGARLQLNVSVLNVRNGNVMLGPTPASETLHAPAQARSAEFYGFGVSIPLGRDSRVQTSNDLLHNVLRIMREN
jgi:hypothetical protein